MMKIIKKTFKLYSYLVGSLMIFSIAVNVLNKYYFDDDIADIIEKEETAHDETF